MKNVKPGETGILCKNLFNYQLEQVLLKTYDMVEKGGGESPPSPLSPYNCKVA